MNRKSITQEYFALVTDKNGNMPPMHKDESNAGVVVSGFMDLLLNDVITVEKKKITVIKELPEGLRHIGSLYTYLNEKPRSTDKLMNDYYMNSRLKQFITEIGESLVADGVATEGNGGSFGPKTTYISEKNYKDELINTIKTALARDDEITSHDVALIYILNGTKNLNQYFSRHESEELQIRLKEMKKNPQNKQLTEMINYVSDMITIIMACAFTYSI